MDEALPSFLPIAAAPSMEDSAWFSTCTRRTISFVICTRSGKVNGSETCGDDVVRWRRWRREEREGKLEEEGKGSKEEGKGGEKKEKEKKPSVFGGIGEREGEGWGEGRVRVRVRVGVGKGGWMLWGLVCGVVWVVCGV